MELAGISMALGAFIAGLLADSEYRHELESQIEPFKGLLLGLFISISMPADIRLLFAQPRLVLALTTDHRHRPHGPDGRTALEAGARR